MKRRHKHRHVNRISSNCSLFLCVLLDEMFALHDWNESKCRKMCTLKAPDRVHTASMRQNT